MLPFPQLRRPIVQAPMAGGPSTPELAAAVSDAGGLGFLAAGYKTPDGLREEIRRTRALTDGPFGVNLFVLAEPELDAEALARYGEVVAAEAARLGARAGEPRFEDDALAAKLEVVLEERVPVVSFTFGSPPREAVERLHERGLAAWGTATEVEEALAARDAGADALFVQGVEAGAHRGSFRDADGHGELGLLPLLRLAARAVDLPLVAAGGIADGAGVAAALAAGARAAALGTAFLRCPEAGTSDVHRRALGAPARPTALTRAFTGRRARAIVNRFVAERSAEAPAAYPHVHHLTAPLRAAARAAGEADAVNLWAGQAYPLGEDAPAAELVARWAGEAAAALAAARATLG